MSFHHIIGHTRQVTLLRRAVRNGTVPHALLITGISGNGKKTVARGLAQALLCHDPGSGDACGVCDACRRNERGVHPDMHEILPEGAWIKIDQVRDVIRAMRFRPVLGAHRVFLMFEAQQMLREAANALLKSLEEPPEGTFFVLTAPEDRALLPTVVSRCQRMELAPLPESLIADALVQTAGMSREEAMVLASLSGGSLGRALEAASTDHGKADTPAALRREVIRRLQGLKKNDIKSMLFLAKIWSSLPDEKNELLDILCFWLRDRLLMAHGVPADRLINRDVMRRSGKDFEPMEPERIYETWDRMTRASRALKQNATKRLVLESLLLHLAGASNVRI